MLFTMLMLDERGRRRLLKRFRIPMLVLCILFGGYTLCALAASGDMRRDHTIVIAAPPEKIVPFITNLRRWQEWSTWTPHNDPQLRNTYDGPEDGVGSRWAWIDSTGRAAELEIAHIMPGFIGVKLHINSFEPSSGFRFFMTREPEGTRLTWSHEGAARWFVLLIQRAGGEQLDEEIETSLNNLKTVVEATQ